jgi:aspartate/methionine/tyrosine aminotransferase
VASAEQALRAGRTGYPDNQGEPALRRVVAGRLLRDQGLSYDPASEILITDGATCGIALALGALLQPGDEVLLPDPIYDAYASPIALFGGRAVAVPSVVNDGRFTLEVAALARARTPRTRALLLNNPWNPVGTAFTHEELQQIVEFVVAEDIILISDEIYATLLYDGRRHVATPKLAGAQPRTILVNSLSKTYAMTGWRVGYVAAPADLIRATLLLLQQFSRGPATFVQDAAVCALEGPQDSVERMAAEYQARRDLVVRALQGLPGIRPLIPDGGLFVMVDLREALARSDEPDCTSDGVRRFLLEQHGVVVIHGSAYGAVGESFLRVSFAAGGETLQRGLDLLRTGLNQVASGEWRKVRR